MLRAEEVIVLLAEDELLGVEEARNRRRSGAGRLAISRPNSMSMATPLPLSLAPTNTPRGFCRVAHGKGQRIVVRAKQDPLLLSGCQRTMRLAMGTSEPSTRMRHGEPLELDLAAQLLEMLGQELLLGSHAGRSATSRPDGDKLS